MYVAFYSLSATDACGYIQVTSQDFVASTMLAFRPEELSTIAGRLDDIIMYDSVSGKPLVTEPYNFADLPCPPRSKAVKHGSQSIQRRVADLV